MEEGIPRAVMAKNMNYKLVFRADGVSEFYDLKEDPRELTNMYDNVKYKEVSVWIGVVVNLEVL